MTIPFVLLLKSAAGGAFGMVLLLMVVGPLVGHAASGVEQTAAAIAGALIGAWVALRD